MRLPQHLPRAHALLLLASLALATSSSSFAEADAVRGESLYDARCEGCHSLDANRIGPMHRGVYGRTAGTVPGYSYSDALRRSRITWDNKSLDRWLTNPEGLVPGQKMGYRVDDPKDRQDIIAFLRTARP